MEYPTPFGREQYPAEAYIADLDSKSGSSLKVRLCPSPGTRRSTIAMSAYCSCGGQSGFGDGVCVGGGGIFESVSVSGMLMVSEVK